MATAEPTGRVTDAALADYQAHNPHLPIGPEPKFTVKWGCMGHSVLAGLEAAQADAHIADLRKRGYTAIGVSYDGSTVGTLHEEIMALKAELARVQDSANRDNMEMYEWSEAIYERGLTDPEFDELYDKIRSRVKAKIAAKDY